MSTSAESASRPWRENLPPDRLIGRGHPAGDFLEAYDWLVEEREPGRLVVLAHVPARVRKPLRGPRNRAAAAATMVA